MKTILLSLALLLLCSACTVPATAQRVTMLPGTPGSLEQRWMWAVDQLPSGCKEGCWVGYSIDRLMRVDNRVGSWSDDPSDETLEEIIYDRKTPDEERFDRSHSRDRNRARYDDSEQEKVVREVAFLFRYTAGGKQVDDLRIGQMNMQMDLHDLPVFWLGKADHDKSVEYLVRRFDKEGDKNRRRDLLVAVALHEPGEPSQAFLKRVLTGTDDPHVRSQAAFWIAEHGGSGLVALLDNTARTDPSREVREQAVFGLSRMQGREAEDRLIALARGGAENRHTREQAIFWLGQKASQRAAEELGSIAENDPETEVQKKAVFALSQIKEDDGITRLIQIARTHRNPQVRRDAIFWLGQSGDPRAVDVLVDIVKGN